MGMALSNPANSDSHRWYEVLFKETQLKQVNISGTKALHLPCFYLRGLVILLVIAVEGEIPKCFLNALLKL